MKKHLRPGMPLKEPKAREPHHQVIVDLLKVLRPWAVEQKQVATGQATLEKNGFPPVVCAYAVYPNGDYLAWFNDNVKFTIYALVNEKFQEVVSANTFEDMMKKAQELQPRLGRPASEASEA